MAFTYSNHGDGYQVVWANGKWVIVTDTLVADDVVQYAFEEDSAPGGEIIQMAMHHYTKNLGA